MESNHHEAHARAVKVQEIYLVARARHITALQVATDQAVRDSLVCVARMRVPSMRTPSDVTWAMVVQTLAMAEQFDTAGATVASVA